MQQIKYLVNSRGRQSKPMTRAQIRELCACERIGADATVSIVGTSLRTPILVFLGQSEPSNLRKSATDFEPAAKNARWPTIVILCLLLLALGGVGVMWNLTQQMTQNLAAQKARMDQLEQQLGQLLDDQHRMLNEMQRMAGRQPAAPQQQRTAEQASEIRELVGAVADYRDLIQALSTDVGADHRKTQETDQMLQSMMQRLQHLGVGADGNPLPPNVPPAGNTRSLSQP